MGSDDPKRAKNGCARATNLKKCARNAISSTRPPRAGCHPASARGARCSVQACATPSAVRLQVGHGGYPRPATQDPVPIAAGRTRPCPKRPPRAERPLRAWRTRRAGSPQGSALLGQNFQSGAFSGRELEPSIPDLAKNSNWGPSDASPDGKERGGLDQALGEPRVEPQKKAQLRSLPDPRGLRTGLGNARSGAKKGPDRKFWPHASAVYNPRRPQVEHRGNSRPAARNLHQSPQTGEQPLPARNPRTRRAACSRARRFVEVS